MSDANAALSQAEALLENYGNGARLQAALSAHRALQLKDLDACRFWKQVLDFLERHRTD